MRARVRVRVRVRVWVWVWVRVWVRVGLRHLLPLEKGGSLTLNLALALALTLTLSLRHLLPLEGGEAGEELVEYHPEGPPVTGGFEAPCATLDRLGRLGRGEG